MVLGLRRPHIPAAISSYIRDIKVYGSLYMQIVNSIPNAFDEKVFVACSQSLYCHVKRYKMPGFKDEHLVVSMTA